MTRHSLDCPTALVIFKITHHDRAGESSSLVLRYGEIVATNHDGQAVIAAEDGTVIHCPAHALHRVDDDAAKRLPGERVDHLAVMELTRFIPAGDVPFTVTWLDLPAALEVAAATR